MSELELEVEETYNAANEDHVKKAKKRDSDSKTKRLITVQALMSRPETRSYLYSILDLCNVFRTSYDTSPNTVYFREGARNVGLKVLADINEAAPDQYMVMIKENKK